MSTHTQTSTHRHTHTHAHTHIHGHTHRRTHAHILTYARNTYANIHKHTHTHTNTQIHTASHDLCHSLALLARRLCTVCVDPQVLAPLMACCLIELDKRPGVRPIGICETARRIIIGRCRSGYLKQLQGVVYLPW